MSEFAFGRNFDLQTRPEHRYMVDGITTLHKFNSAYVQSLDLVKYHMEKIFSPQGLWYGWKFLQIARKLAESRNLPNTTMNPGVFWQMSNFQETSNANKFSMDELWAESKFLMVTGGWSPASALASLLFYLSRYPSCHRRVTAEVRSIFDKASEIHSGSQMTSCHYLRACILESLRMSPPGGAVLWREVERNAMMIDGHAVPPGCDVGTGMYSIHHNENYFPDSFTFKPERWLDDDQRVCQNLDQGHRAFTAFSIGPRSCLGRSLVMMELTDIAALLLWHLDFRLPAGPEAQIGAGTEGLRGRHRIDEFQQRDHIFSFFDGPCLEFRQRHFDISIK
ncbi:MAG: hypothetical protein M1820_010507 [Bogoriella megaspora]|nr:MAG: hypothetical protein M1820_010507 [Bogoriella megaspora]